MKVKPYVKAKLLQQQILALNVRLLDRQARAGEIAPCEKHFLKFTFSMGELKPPGMKVKPYRALRQNSSKVTLTTENVRLLNRQARAGEIAPFTDSNHTSLSSCMLPSGIARLARTPLRQREQRSKKNLPILGRSVFPNLDEFSEKKELQTAFDPTPLIQTCSIMIKYYPIVTDL